MLFRETPLPGVYVIEMELKEDQRGFFARTWCRSELSTRGLETHIAQCSISSSRRAGTIRGLHFQLAPREETKLIRCTRGAIYDVVDIRPESPTFRQWFGTELTAANRLSVYVPRGCAHGFQTIEDESEVHYHISEFHDTTVYRGVRWNDPAFNVVWPIPASNISDWDRSHPDFDTWGAAPVALPKTGQ